MSVYAGPEFNESGLIYYHDMNNRKSYAGAPTTNHVPNADTMPGWSTYGGTPVAFQTEFGTTGYRLTNAPSWNGIYRTVTLPSTGTYTFSAWIRYLGGSPNNNGGTVYISGWGGGDTSTAVNKSIIGQWQRVTRTLTVTTTSMTFYIISFGGTNDGNSDRSSWEITMPQVEAGSVATTFVAGSRSSTQVLRDLTSRNTVTANSLTYNTDNTFNFNGSSNDLSISGESSSFFTDFSSQQISLDVWINIPSSATWTNGFFGNILSRGSFSGSCGIWRTTTNNQVAAYFRQSGATFAAVQSSAIIQRDVWTHLVATWTGNILTLYVNGIAQSTNSGTLGTPTVADWTVGNATAASGSAGNRFQGQIPTVKIYSRALPAAEVFSNFTASRLRYGI
jgi:hypothetical protein